VHGIAATTIIQILHPRAPARQLITPQGLLCRLLSELLLLLLGWLLLLLRRVCLLALRACCWAPHHQQGAAVTP
jgi:hypothetical protein